MQYPLEEFQTIPESARQQLKQENIENSDDLLRRAATPRQRNQLCQATEIATDNLVRWVGAADLVRIQGIEPATAELLVSSGLAGNVQQFLACLHADRRPDPDERAVTRIAEREPVHAAATQLAARLAQHSQADPAQRPAPGVAELCEAAEEAAELRPRLVLADPHRDDAFRQYVRNRSRVEKQASWRVSLVIAGIVLVALGLVLLVLFIWSKALLDRLSSVGNPLTVTIAELWRTSFNSLLLSLALLGGMILLALFLLLKLYDVVSYALNTRLVTFLFDTPTRQALYQKIESIGLERQMRGVRWGIGVMAAIAIGLVIYALLFTVGMPEEELGTFGDRLYLPMAVAGVVMVFAIALPVIKFYVIELDTEQEAADSASFQAYLIYLLSKWAWLPLMVIVLVKVVFPGVFAAHRYVYRSYILPPLEAKVAAGRNAILAIEIDDPDEDQRRDRLLRTFDNTVTDELPVYGCVAEESVAVYDLAIPLAQSLAFWWAFAGVATLFVLPFFVLGGLGRGIFYMVLLAASFYIENALQASTPAWFSLTPGSVAEWLIVAVAVLANALFFEWLYSRAADRQKVCPACKAEVSADAAYCLDCGLEQPPAPPRKWEAFKRFYSGRKRPSAK